MNKFINNQEFMAEIFEDESIAERAGEIGDAILNAALDTFLTLVQHLVRTHV